MKVARAAALAALAALAGGCLSKPGGLTCELEVVGAGQLDGQIGTKGGVPSGMTDCRMQAVVGAVFEMTRNPNQQFDQKTAIRAGLLCAPLSYADGGYTAGTAEDPPSIGGSVMDLDGPFMAECPAGRVVVGLAAKLVGNGGLFNSIAIDCATLDPGGAATDDVMRVPVIGTGTAEADAEAACQDGRILHGFESVSGSELDQLRLRCSEASCGPRNGPGPGA